ncbi:hypothetical protein Tco_0464147, partial [Tanacetum coccineum]
MDVTTIVTPSDVEKVMSNHESAGVENNSNEVEPKTVSENSFIPPIIEDWNSDDESEIDYTVIPSIEKIKFVKPARETVEKGNSQQKEYKEKGVIDSGCSRRMTGNKCYLAKYEDYDGGFVSFGDGKGRITIKGKIKTGTLDFDDLLDESQVMLRVPRKDNIYSVDLKSVVPTGGLTCLFAKATIDDPIYGNRRLGHINFKTMNKLARGNLVKGFYINVVVLRGELPEFLHGGLLRWRVAQEVSCFILSSELLTSGLNRWRVAQEASCFILSSELLTSDLLTSGLN